MLEADWQGGVNLASANLGKLSVALGNSHNLFKPQLPSPSRQVIMPPSWGCGEGATRCHEWRHLGHQESPFMDWFSIQQADVSTLLTRQAPRMGQSHGQVGSQVCGPHPSEYPLSPSISRSVSELSRVVFPLSAAGVASASQ